MRKFALLAAAALAATTAATPAWAEISITDMQQVSQGQTIQFPVQPDGTSVIGFTNQTNTSVTFSTLSGQTLDTPSQGQARIQAVSGTTVVPLSSLLINLTAPNTTFGYIEFNLFGGTQLADATSVTIHALDALGNPFDLVVPIGNGENFFSALATNGERIASISFNSGNTTGVTDIRQIRINLGENLQAVPEPATWAMMLLGFGAAGMAMRRTRRRKGLLAQIA
jgi:hypothetical protein